MSEDHTESDLISLISSLLEGLELYESSLEPSKLTKIETSNNDDSKSIKFEEELVKLSKLIFAHSTKIGIAFRAPVSINAGYAQLKETSEVFLILIGVIAQIYNSEGDDDQFGEVYKSAILENVKSLVSLFKGLLQELKVLDFSKGKGDDVDESGRLVGVGKVWNSCEKLEALIKEGKVGLLKGKIRLSVAVIEDLIEEFEEWLENPEVVDDSFGFNDDDDDDDENDDEDGKDKEIDPEVVEFAKTWMSKVKMVKLLFSSFIKSLPADSTDVSGKQVDIFNKEQNNLFNLVDDLVASMFLNTQILELRIAARKIHSQSDVLIKLLKSLNKDDEKKTKWLSIWQEKFIQ